MKRTIILQDIQAKIRELELYTKRLLSSSLVGDSRSSLKGTGLEFNQIREYQLGDDIRFIDWSASARMNTTLVKEYREERSRTVFIAIDVSNSMYYASGDVYKHALCSRVAAVLTLVTHYGNDCVGLILFSDTIECYIPPRKGRNHAYLIIERILMHEPKNVCTSINSALQKLMELKQKDALVFLISDYIDDTIGKNLGVVARLYDFIAIRCTVPYEYALPKVGLLNIVDCETGEQMVLDLRDKKNQLHINTYLTLRMLEQSKLFKQHNIDVIDINDEQRYIGHLIRFFRHRMRY